MSRGSSTTLTIAASEPMETSARLPLAVAPADLVGGWTNGANAGDLRVDGRDRAGGMGPVRRLCHCYLDGSVDGASRRQLSAEGHVTSAGSRLDSLGIMFGTGTAGSCSPPYTYGTNWVQFASGPGVETEARGASRQVLPGAYCVILLDPATITADDRLSSVLVAGLVPLTVPINYTLTIAASGAGAFSRRSIACQREGAKHGADAARRTDVSR